MIYVKSFLVGLVSLLLAAVTFALSLTLVNFLHKSPPLSTAVAMSPRHIAC